MAWAAVAEAHGGLMVPTAPRLWPPGAAGQARASFVAVPLLQRGPAEPAAALAAAIPEEVARAQPDACAAARAHAAAAAAACSPAEPSDVGVRALLAYVGPGWPRCCARLTGTLARRRYHTSLWALHEAVAAALPASAHDTGRRSSKKGAAAPQFVWRSGLQPSGPGTAALARARGGLPSHRPRTGLAGAALVVEAAAALYNAGALAARLAMDADVTTLDGLKAAAGLCQVPPIAGQRLHPPPPCAADLVRSLARGGHVCAAAADRVPPLANQACC
jgi:hypothetical protein